MPKQYRVRIKDGRTHGAGRQHKAGDVITVSEAEIEAFKDKFVVLGSGEAGEEEVMTLNRSSRLHVSTPGADFDLAAATADEIVAAVQGGKVTAEAALAAEQERARPRKTVLTSVFNLAGATADEVVAAVQDGQVTAEAALAAEQGRAHPRKTVLTALTPKPAEGE